MIKLYFTHYFYKKLHFKVINVLAMKLHEKKLMKVTNKNSVHNFSFFENKIKLLNQYLWNQMETNLLVITI